MLTDFSAVLELASMELASQYDESVSGKLSLLLQNPDAELTFLLIARPIRQTAEASGIYAVMEESIFGQTGADAFGQDVFAISDRGYQTGIAGASGNEAWSATTAPANTNFPPRLLSPLEYSSRVPFPGSDGSGSISLGNIVINNADAGLDGWLSDVWVGRELEVKIGAQDFPYAEFETFFRGRIGGISWDEREIVLAVSDPSERIRQPVNERHYHGDGGLDGGAIIEGSQRPLLFGARNNIPAVLVDPANRIYQIHDGSMDGVSECRDNGVPLAFNDDVAVITTATPAPGEYATSLATGFIKLGSTAAGQITVDATGDNAGGYVSTAARIVERIALSYVGFSAAEIDGASVAAAAAAAPATVGFWTGLEHLSASDVFDSLMVSVGGWWTFDRAGLLTLGILQAPDTPAASFDSRTIGAIRRLTTAQPLKTVCFNYAKNAVVQSADSLAASLTDEQRQGFSQEYRKILRESPRAASLYASARTHEANSLINLRADAEAEADRLIARDSVPRDLYEMTILRHLWQQKIGDTVEVSVTGDGNSLQPRFGLSGRRFRVVGISESAAERSATLLLWG